MQLKKKQNKTKQKNYTEFSPHAKTTDNDIDNNNNNNNNNNTNNRKLIKKKDKTKQRKTLTNIEKYKKKYFLNHFW